MINQGDVLSLLFMGVIFVGIIAMALFFYNSLKKAHGEKKNDPAVGSAFSRAQPSGNSAVTAAISAAVNEYRKNK
jgi:heme/copper-type cytochrome/quinol oxidase subunit 2